MENPNQTAEQALALFDGHANCAQSVYAACGAGGGLNQAQRMAVALAFGGGMGRQGKTCGAVTGALMALGEQSTRGIAADRTAARDAVYARAKQLIDDFRAEFGSVDCRALTGCRLDSEEGHKKFAEQRVRERVCRRAVDFAARWVAESGEPQG